MQERDIDNARWVKQRKSEKYEKRKQKYLLKRRQQSQAAAITATKANIQNKDLTLSSEDNRRRSISCESEGPLSDMAASDHEKSSYQSSPRDTLNAFPLDSPLPLPSGERSFCFPDTKDSGDHSLLDITVSSEQHSIDNSGTMNTHDPVIDSPQAPLESMSSFMSNDSSEFHLHRQDSEDKEEQGELDELISHSPGNRDSDSDREEDEEGQEEELSTPYEVYFEFFVSPTLLLFANLLKTIIMKCDRITSWNLLNQIWLETLPHIKNNLAKYNFADYMLRYSIQSNAHLRVIQFFLCVGGSDPNSQDRWLRTPLHYAVVYNRPDILRFLLLIGADSSIPGAICISSNSSTFQTSSQVNYNLYTPKELLLHLNISSSAPSLMLLKERCCLWCQKLFQSAEKSSSGHPLNNGNSGYVRAYCGLCTIPFCVQCIQYHKCVYSIDKYEYHLKYLPQYLQSSCTLENKTQTEPTTEIERGQRDDEVNGIQQKIEDRENHLTPLPDSDDDDLSEKSEEEKREDNNDLLQEVGSSSQSSTVNPSSILPPLYPSDALESHFSDDQSEAMIGRESADSGFGSADEVNIINSCSDERGNRSDQVDDIEESDKEDGSDSDEEQTAHSYDPISLVRPFKKFLGKKKTNPTEGSIVVAEEADLTTLSSRSSKPSSLLPWKRNSQLHVEVEENTSPRQDSKSVFSRARTMSVDLGLLTGEKKEKKSFTSPVVRDSPVSTLLPGEQLETPSQQYSSDNNQHPNPEKVKNPPKKLGGMMSISDSLRKLTKGIGRSTTAVANSNQPAESVTSYLCNDEPIAKFTADGIPVYWVGYQETQFIALQPWQILLLPIVYHTEKYYDSALVPPLSPLHGLEDSLPPESLFSPKSAVSG